ncbi:hypothetical protein [Thermodesulfitimonas autotrophica]|uniref:hypothetical protein n=1 Tax=Thermodesulfitimonas autotrophica TaxID=1894989 RepID=UPI002FDFAB2A
MRLHDDRQAGQDCLTEEEALKFVLAELSEEEEERAAAHLADCERCLRRVRRMRQADRLLSVWAARTHAEASRAARESWVVAAAAAAPESRQPVEIETADGRYRLGRYPEREGNRWLLVVEPNFACPDGSEIIVRHEATVLRLLVAGGRASALFETAPDLEKLIVSCLLPEGNGGGN